MAKTQTVTISLEEYKELLLKDKPTNRDHEICERIISAVGESLKYSEEHTWDNDYIGDNMEVQNGNRVVKEIMRIFKYLDFERYMKIWNEVQTAERNRKAMQEQIDQMNRAKELREENKNG